MAYNALNNLIDAYIYPNGVQAITGSILNNVLKAMVSQLGGGYNLMGVATPASSPAVNDEPLAYFAATAGTYTNFGNLVLVAGEVAVLLTSGNGSWSKQTIYNVPTGTADLANTAGFITSAVNSLVNYYTKTEIDTALAGYTTTAALATALADYYNKSSIDAQMATRYTKSEVDTKLGDYYRKTETYDKDEVDSIVAALSRQEYIVAWDGSSAPVVADIPAGVTVTYSGTPYTGTLAASASTVNKIYMVWNGVAYDMYGTSADGGYSWVPMGTTSVDLSQYATKTELDQLSLEVDEIKSQKFLFENGTTPGYIALDGTQTIYWPYGYISAYIPVKAGTEVKVHGAADTDNLVIAFYDGDKNFYSAGKVAGDGLATLKDYSSTAAQDGFVRCYTDNKIVLTAWTDSYILIGDEVLHRSDVAEDFYDNDKKVMPLSLGKEMQEDVSEIVQMIDGYSKPVPQTVIEGSMNSNGTFTTQYGLSYIIVDVRDLVGYTITVKTTNAAQQYALLSDYNTTSATFASGCSRESGNVTDLQIPGDAKYLYLLTGDYSDPILPSQIATSKDSEGLANLLKDIRKPYLINTKDNQNRWQYEIFLPCYDGENWVHLFLQHIVNNGINADNWRIKTAFLNDGIQDITRLAGDGEWEMALQLVGRPDFIGGSMHGNEVVNYLTVYVDGVIAGTPVVSSGGKKEFDTLTILESTNLYDPNDNSTLVAEHLKKYTFTKDGVNLIQRINWKGDFPLTYSYIAMLPADRTYNGEQITDYWYDDKTFLRYDVSSSGFGDYPTQMKTGVTGQFLCGETSRVSMSVELVRMSPKIDEAISFLSDSVYFNKIYFSMCGQSYSVQNGDVWITEANYKLNKTK